MSHHKTLHTFEEWKALGYFVMKGARTVGFYNNIPMFSGAQVVVGMGFDDLRPHPEELWEPPVDEEGEDALSLYHQLLTYAPAGLDDFSP